MNNSIRAVDLKVNGIMNRGGLPCSKYNTSITDLETNNTANKGLSTLTL